MKVAGMLVGKLEFKTPKGDHAKTDNQIRALVILNALKIDAKD